MPIIPIKIKLTQVTTNPNSDNSPSWSPDGKHTCNYNGWYDFWYATQYLAIAASTGGETEVLTKTLDRNISKPKFSKDGNPFIF
jgi:Tol biopolymer transport system component